MLNYTTKVAARRTIAEVTDLLGAPGYADRAELLAVLAEVHRGEMRSAIDFGAGAALWHGEAIGKDPLLLDALTDQYLDREAP